MPRATLGPDARVHTRPSPSALPPPLALAPRPPPLAASPSLLTQPPAHLHLPPGPGSPGPPRGRASSVVYTPAHSLAPTPSLCCSDDVRETRPGLGSQRDLEALGVEGGAEVGDPAAPGTRPPGAAPGVLPQSGRATARSPTFLKPLERHLRDGGWGWGVPFQVSQRGPLCGPSSHPRAGLAPLRAPSPQTINYQPPFCRERRGAGWLAAARKRQPGSLLHDN